MQNYPALVLAKRARRMLGWMHRVLWDLQWPHEMKGMVLMTHPKHSIFSSAVCLVHCARVLIQSWLRGKRAISLSHHHQVFSFEVPKQEALRGCLFVSWEIWYQTSAWMAHIFSRRTVSSSNLKQWSILSGYLARLKHHKRCFFNVDEMSVPFCYRSGLFSV